MFFVWVRTCYITHDMLTEAREQHFDIGSFFHLYVGSGLELRPSNWHSKHFLAELSQHTMVFFKNASPLIPLDKTYPPLSTQSKC